MKILKDNIKKEREILKHVTLDGVRLHLKTDERKLWINGYYVLYLNQTANLILSKFIDSCYEVKQQEVMRHTILKLKKIYPKVSYTILEKDIHNIIGIINSFARNEIPQNLVGVSIIKEENKTAPNRMDMSLTYECNNKCPHCYLLENSNKGTLNTEQWKKIIDKLWNVGIPQIVFTGGECTLREDLPELIGYGKKFLTGIITNGTNLSSELVKKLKRAELDWIQITLDSDKEKTHDKIQGRKRAFKETINGIKNSVREGIQTNINMTLTSINKNDLMEVIKLGKKLGVNSVSTNALINSGRAREIKDKDGVSEKELNEILKEGKEYANKIGIEFNWFLPTCYKNLNPIELGFGQRCCSACSVNMMIEPNGDVIPCQSWTEKKLGNILIDDWNKIWKNEEAEKIRNFGYAPKECKFCEYIKVCGGGCPLEKINCRRCGK